MVIIFNSICICICICPNDENLDIHGGLRGGAGSAQLDVLRAVKCAPHSVQQIWDGTIMVILLKNVEMVHAASHSRVVPT